MDERKENKTQVELESSANADPLSDEPKADRDSGALEDTQKEAESEPSIIAPESPDDPSEDEFGSETADGIKTEPKLSEIEATDQQTEDGSETVEVSEGQGAEKNDGSESDVSDTEDAVTSQKADESGGDRQIADAESKDTGSLSVTESDDENLSDDDKAGPAQEEKEFLLSKTDPDQKSENDNLTEVEPDGTSEPAVSKTSSKDEEKDSAGEEQADSENDNTEKNPSEQQSDDPEGETEDLPELEPKKKTPWVKAALAAIVVAAVFSGFFVFENKSNMNAVRESKSKEVENAVTSEASYLKTKPAIQPDDPNHIYNAKIKEIRMLREMLLRKKEEIAQLKKQYEDGITELEKEILDEMRSAQTDTFLQALETKRIEFGLRTIQRRNAYMRQLNQPSEWIYRACEELLYLKRRALVDLQVAEVASGMDMNMHMQHMNTALEKYRPTADRLAVDMKDAQLESLEEIWEQIQTRNLQPSNSHAVSRNKVISEQVCSGIFKRVTELSEISVEAAKCIAEMPGSDLFLNDLNEITPRAAKYLFQWKGSWLCLNGFQALSPRVASYLFQWDGGWISLNGLTEFPAEIGEVLLQWPGKQLELMGLRYTNNSYANIGIEYLAQWERAGGKLFVPKEVRNKIDELKGDSV